MPDLVLDYLRLDDKETGNVCVNPPGHAHHLTQTSFGHIRFELINWKIVYKNNSISQKQSWKKWWVKTMCIVWYQVHVPNVPPNNLL